MISWRRLKRRYSKREFCLDQLREKRTMLRKDVWKALEIAHTRFRLTINPTRHCIGGHPQLICHTLSLGRMFRQEPKQVSPIGRGVGDCQDVSSPPSACSLV